MSGRLLISGASGFTGRRLAQQAGGRSAGTVRATRNRRRLQRMTQVSGLLYRVRALEDARGVPAHGYALSGCVRRTPRVINECIVGDGDAWCKLRHDGMRLSRRVRRVAHSGPSYSQAGAFAHRPGLVAAPPRDRPVAQGRVCSVHRHPEHRGIRERWGVGAIVPPVDRLFCRLRLAPARKLLELDARFLPEGALRGAGGRRRREVIVAEVEDRYRVRERSPTATIFTALSALAIAERAIAGDIRTGF
jgi:hypothetical protein